VVQRQTRDAQNVVPQWAWEFESPLGHFNFAGTDVLLTEFQHGHERKLAQTARGGAGEQALNWLS
jgi:hypothetical protein